MKNKTTKKESTAEHLAYIYLPIPHGRIADIDALKATFCAECSDTTDCENCDIDYHFEHMAPVLIEAMGDNTRNNKRGTFNHD